MKRAVALVVLGVTLLSGSASTAPSGSFTKHRYTAKDATFSRDYWLFVPARREPSAPLVDYLHGCNQTAVDAAVGTRWNELAARRGFVVVYPEQFDDEDIGGIVAGRGNGSQCWNWFRPDIMGRDIGEPGTVAAITRTVLRTYHLDARRVYVIGASAGADLAVAMAAFYPDLYAALGVLAGCPYLDCADLTGRAAYEAMGDLARPVPVFAAQGTADMVNNLAMGAALVQQWLGTDDLADNGAPDGSVSAAPASVDHHGFDASALDGVGSPGDVCGYPTRLPCLGGAAGFKSSYPYSVARYVDADGRSLIDHWIVHGLNHAYPNGNTKGDWTDPLGPDITTAAYRFFLEHRRR